MEKGGGGDSYPQNVAKNYVFNSFLTVHFFLLLLFVLYIQCSLYDVLFTLCTVYSTLFTVRCTPTSLSHSPISTFKNMLVLFFKV